MISAADSRLRTIATWICALASVAAGPLAGPWLAAPAISRGGSGSASGPRIVVHARALVPGELVRIELESSEPISHPEGRFLGQDLFFSPRCAAAPAASLKTPTGEPQEIDGIAPPSRKALPEGAGGPDRAPGVPPDPSVAPGAGEAPPCEAWSAWASIPLDQKPGRAGIEVHARCGRAEATTRLVLDIKKKSFPSQKLTVDQNMVTPPPELEARIESERRRVAEISAVRRPAPVPVRPFVRPVPGEPTSIFGTRRLYNGTPRPPHPGLDLHAGTGTPVEASGDGVVVLAEELYFSGNTVIVDHGGGLFTIYAHLSKIEVAAGDAVEAGQRVGLSGATGRVTGPHLHWGAKIGDRPFDPTALLSPAVFR